MNQNNLKNIDLNKVDINQLIDINQVVIDESAPKSKKIEAYIKQIKNPYCFKVGKTVVKVSFSEGGGSFQDCLETALKAM